MTAWMGTILWLITGTLLLTLLRVYRSSLDDIPGVNADTSHRVYSIIQGLIGIITAIGVLLSQPVAEEYFGFRNQITTGVIGFWWIWTILMLRKLRYEDHSRSITIGLTTLIALYLSAITWGHLPTPLMFVAWFRDLSPQLQSTTALIGGVLTALFVHNVILPITNRMAGKTETTLDDTLFSIVRWPISISIALIGVGYSIETSLLSQYWADKFHRVAISAFILVWTQVTLKVISLLLQHMREAKKHWQLINDRTMPIFLLLLRIGIITFSIYFLLLTWDIDVMFYITTGGVIGIAIAYASQDTLSSLFAGVAILTDAPYKLHDFLVLDDQTRGKVTHIGFRSTRLLTTENIEVIIPNSIMANAQIINMTGGETSIARIEIAAGVAYGSDVEQVRSLLLEVAHKLDHIILDQPHLEPVAHFTSMGASSLDFTLRLWVQHPERLLNIQDQANTLIYTTFTEHGIEIPYTKQDVYMYSMGTPTS